MTNPARPRVDVGVVTWNTRDLTVDALRRLLDDDQGVDLRLLVRDNGSTDGTVEAIARAIPEALIDADGDNLGFGRGVNRLLARSDAPWFLTLNSDAWPEPGAIRRMVDAAVEHPRCAAVAPLLLRPDGSLEHSTQAFPSARVAVLATGPFFSRRHPDRARDLMFPGAWLHDEPRTVDWAVGAALLFRRTAIDVIGGFDERLFMYAEDLEWCLRAHRSGWTIWFEPSAVIRHVGNASGRQSYGAPAAPRRVAAYWRNTYRVHRWYHGPVATTALRGANILRAGSKWARYAGRDKGAARYWRAQLRAHVVSTRQADGPPAG
jgi:GT2 family glycosyltransferase